MSLKSHRQTNARHLSRSDLHNSVSRPSILTALYSTDLVHSKGRPKHTLSAFATKKRAKSPSPVGELKPAKRQKISENPVGNNLAKSAGVSAARTVRGTLERRVGSEEVGSASKGGQARADKSLPSSNGHDLEDGRGEPLLTGTDKLGTSPPFTTNRVSAESSGTCRGRHVHRGAKVTSESDASRETQGTFNFEQLFGYYPPKLVIQNGDLCPEHSLSVSGLERSKLNSLPATHPFWNWTLGQPINKPAAPSVKTSRRKQKSKTNNSAS